MKRQWSTLVVLAGSLVFLASLYLPWQEASCSRIRNGGIAGLGSFCASVGGLSSEAGRAAALVSLVLAATAATALVRPHLEHRLPIGACAVAIGYFALAVTRETESVARRYGPGLPGPLHIGFGTYLGLTAGAVALLGATVPRARALVGRSSPLRLVRTVAVAGLLAMFLLPWQSLSRDGAGTFPFLGIERPAAVLAAVCAVLLLATWWKTDTDTSARAALLGLTIVLLTSAALTANAYPVPGHATAAWAALCFAVALTALGPVGLRASHARRRPSLPGAAAWFAAAIFVVGLFLPWQQECGRDIRGAFSQQCVSFNGWTFPEATAAAVLALVLAVVLAGPKRSIWAIELGVGFGLLVTTAGFQLQEFNGFGDRIEFGYGATTSFAGAALLVVTVLALAGSWVYARRTEWLQAPERIAPIATCVAYLVVLTLPLWSVLPQGSQTALQFAPPSWLTIAGALVGIHLLFTWIPRIEGSRESKDLLVVFPLFLLTLAAVDLIVRRKIGISWGGGTIVGLCLILTFFGHAERRGGLRNLKIPGILRLDRIE